MQENNSNSVNEGEVSLKDLLLKIIELYHEVVRYWKLVVLSILLFAGLMFYRAYNASIKFPAKLTFMLNEDNSGGMGAIGGLAASFGLGGMNNGEFNLEKMIALSKSRNIMQQVFFDKGIVKGKNDFYANHIIQEFDLLEKWKKTESLKDFKAFTHQNISEFSKTENRAFKYIHAVIIGAGNREKVLSPTINDLTGIVELEISTTSEDLSINLVNVIFDKLSHFYIDKAIEQQQYTFAITKQKTDSLKKALDYAQSNLLKFKDSHRNLMLRQYEAQELRLQRDAQILTIAYGESLKNQELADFALKSKTPFIQLIDLPISPISREKESKLKAIILGSFLGGFLATVFILGRKIIRDSLNQP